MNAIERGLAVTPAPTLGGAFAAALEWSSDGVTHVDRLQVTPAALHADGRWQPAAVEARLTGNPVALDAAPWCRPAQRPPIVLDVGTAPFPSRFHAGRHYPAGMFGDPVASPRDRFPVRVVTSSADGTLRLDPNHPLSSRAVRLVLQASTGGGVAGVRLADLFDGPGMQAVASAGDACYFPPGALDRRDQSADVGFYSRPRRIQHLDARCRAAIGHLYARLLAPGAVVLDLMASHDSHLPAACSVELSGLGLNQEELEANPLVSHRVVQDLNACPTMPWHRSSFDAVICTAAIEYLIHPQAVVSEIRRILKPGGVFALSFSDRWFPTKAIAVWSELHPYERLGLVLHLLKGAGFVDLHSETQRGWPRPADDKYAAERPTADPLFAAWGYAP